MQRALNEAEARHRLEREQDELRTIQKIKAIQKEIYYEWNWKYNF